MERKLKKENTRNRKEIITMNKTMAETEKCNDKHCALHGELATRGRTFVGTVISVKAQRTVTVEWGRFKKNKKYERYEKARTRVKAHSPDCIDVQKGDKVKIAECRRLSKTKSFVVTEKLGKDIIFAAKEDVFEAAEKVLKEKERKKAVPKESDAVQAVVEAEEGEKTNDGGTPS